MDCDTVGAIFDSLQRQQQIDAAIAETRQRVDSQSGIAFRIAHEGISEVVQKGVSWIMKVMGGNPMVFSLTA